jgi:hypothetical protein
LTEAVLPAPADNRFVRSPRPVDPATFDPNNDQIQCVLRNVGTYDVSPEDVGVAEMRGRAFVPSSSDPPPPASATESQGREGYNVPSLFGISVGAPYFHAGNARTLEEALGELFDQHRSVWADDELFADPAKIDQLVQYLLSIDSFEDRKDYGPIEAGTAVGGVICPDLMSTPPP